MGGLLFLPLRGGKNNYYKVRRYSSTKYEYRTVLTSKLNNAMRRRGGRSDFNRDSLVLRTISSLTVCKIYNKK